MKLVLKNFRVVDEKKDMEAVVIMENGLISEVIPGKKDLEEGAFVIDGNQFPSSASLCLMPAFVDLHAHFRDSLVYGDNIPFPAETIESASMAAAAAGFGTVVCMANTVPVTDTMEKAALIKNRADVLGLLDLYPVLSLTKNLEGKELSGFTSLEEAGALLMLSEDGKDLADEGIFLKAMEEARRLGIPVSCHCDFGGEEAEAAKKAGLDRNVYSRIEENNATERVIELGKKAGCHVHIAHVSTKEAMEKIALAKAEIKAEIEAARRTESGFTLSCEVMPHNLSLTEEDAEKMGAESWGRVNPPLRKDEDRKALIKALAEGIIDAIATDHAPHSQAAKEAGVAGFSAFETAFAASYTELVREGNPPPSPAGNGEIKISMSELSSLMSARPARIIGLGAGEKRRGLIEPGYRADLVIVDTEKCWVVDHDNFKTRGKNSPFQGKQLYGKVLMTFHSGKIVYLGETP